MGLGEVPGWQEGVGLGTCAIPAPLRAKGQNGAASGQTLTPREGLDPCTIQRGRRRG